MVPAGAPLVAAPDPIMLSDVARGTGGFVLYGAAVSQQLGSVLSGGADINGDGLSDVFIGQKSSSFSSAMIPDVNHLVLGKSSTTYIDISDLRTGTSGFVAGLPELIRQPSTAGLLGVSVGVVGDFNGDGLGDLITTPSSTGSVSPLTTNRRFVLYGRTSTEPLDISSINAGMGGLTLQGGWSSSPLQSTQALSVAGIGDVNGDGLADVAVGCPYDSPLGRGNAGSVYVFFGRTAAIPAAHSDVAAGVGGFVIQGVDSPNNIGRQVSGAGDVNGDGLADVLIRASTGAVVVFGRPETTPVDLTLAMAGTGSDGFFLQRGGSIAPSAMSGGGDVNGDGLSDIVLGFAAQEITYVVFGKSAPGTIQLSEVAGGSGGFAVLPGVLASLGASVAMVGDMNGDGLADVAVGAPAEAVPPGGASGVYSPTGFAYVVFGKSSTQPVMISSLKANVGGFARYASGDIDDLGREVAPAGDLNGDGSTDWVVGAPDNHSPFHSRLTLNGEYAGQAFAVFNHLPAPEVSSYTAAVPPGNPGAVGPGGRSFGADRTIFVDSRLWVDFADGSGPGLGGSSALGATIKRTDAGIGGGLDAAATANVQWQVTSNRTNVAAPRVTVRYTDAEIAGLNEGGLTLVTAPTAAGPFVPVGAMTRNATRNELAGTAALPAVFVIVDSSPRATITHLIDNPTLDQNPSWLVAFDKPVAPSFQLFDLMPTGTLASTSLINVTLSGVDPNYVVQAITQRTAGGGTIGFTIPAGAVTSGGLTNPMVEAPAYTIQAAQPAAVAGDMNDDGVVNVADVTALADHIVNGTPLP